MKRFDIILALGLAGLASAAGACSDQRSPTEPSPLPVQPEYVDILVRNGVAEAMDLTLDLDGSRLALGSVEPGGEASFRLHRQEALGLGPARLVATSRADGRDRTSDFLLILPGRMLELQVTPAGVTTVSVRDVRCGDAANLCDRA